MAIKPFIMDETYELKNLSAWLSDYCIISKIYPVRTRKIVDVVFRYKKINTRAKLERDEMDTILVSMID